MGLISWARNRFGKGADIGGWNIPSYIQGRPYSPAKDYKSLVGRYVSWVYACCRLNAISCAQVPLRLYVKVPAKKTKCLFPTMKVPDEQLKYLASSPHIKAMGDVEEVLEHPFLDVMTNVNEFMNAFDLLENLFTYQDLVGNSYWYLVSDTMSMPVEIWPLMPQYVKIVPDKKRFISHYEFKISTETQIIKPDALIHFKQFNPQDALYGMGTLEAALVAADLGMNMNTYEAALFANRAQPDFVITYPVESGAPSDEEVKRVKKEWRQTYAGPKKAGKFGFLFGGAEFKQVSLSPKEMSFLQGRKASLNEVAAIFGVPMSKVTVENVNRANAEAGEYQYMKDTVLPRLRKVEQKLNEQLTPKFDERLFCAFDNPVPQDKEFRLRQIDTHLKNGYASINQERQIDGLEATEWGDVPYMPMNLIPVGMAVTEQPETGAGKGTQIANRNKRPRTLPTLNHPTNFINPPLIREIQDYYKLVGKEVLIRLNVDAGSFKHCTKDRADDFVSGWFDMPKWNKELGQTVAPYWEYTIENGGKRALNSVGGPLEFDVTNERVLGALEKHRYGMVQSVNSTVVKKLRKDLAVGISEGEGIYGLRKRVNNVFGDLEKYQAERIARTETIWAWNEGAVQGYVQSGMVEKKQWVSSGDARSCDWCLSMDGKIVGITEDYFDKGDKFTVNEASLNFTYEDVGHPPIHPMCRCTIIPILE